MAQNTQSINKRSYDSFMDESAASPANASSPSAASSSSSMGAGNGAFLGGGRAVMLPSDWCQSPTNKRHKVIPLTSSSPDAHEAYRAMLFNEQQRQLQQQQQQQQQQHLVGAHGFDFFGGVNESQQAQNSSPLKRSLGEYTSHFRAGLASSFEYEGLDRFLPPMKRRRQQRSSEADQVQTFTNSNNTGHVHHQHQLHQQEQYHHQQEQQQQLLLQQSLQQKQQSPKLASASLSQQGSQAGPALYTEEQVRIIVQGAVRECEERLAELYGNILREKLSEQFENFSKFNEDYISRSLKDSEWSYMS